MPSEIHICYGCGQATASPSAICQDCYRGGYELTEEDFDDRDEYEKEIDELLGYDLDLERE